MCIAIQNVACLSHHCCNCWNSPPTASLYSHPLFGLYKHSTRVSECPWLQFFPEAWVQWYTFLTDIPLHVVVAADGGVWQNGVWHESIYEAKVCHWICVWKKKAPTDIHQHLLNIYGDQTVDVSTARQSEVRFSSGDSENESPRLVQIFISM